MNAYLQIFTGLCLMRLVADLALPEGDIRRYADLGAGLMTMLWMLRCFSAMLGGLA